MHNPASAGLPMKSCSGLPAKSSFSGVLLCRAGEPHNNLGSHSLKSAASQT